VQTEAHRLREVLTTRHSSPARVSIDERETEGGGKRNAATSAFYRHTNVGSGNSHEPDYDTATRTATPATRTATPTATPTTRTATPATHTATHHERDHNTTLSPSSHRPKEKKNDHVEIDHSRDEEVMARGDRAGGVMVQKKADPLGTQKMGPSGKMGCIAHSDMTPGGLKRMKMAEEVCLYVYVCIYIYIYVHVYIYMCGVQSWGWSAACMCIHICVFLCVSIYIHKYVFTYL